MNRIAFACLAAASFLGASPASATTTDQGVVYFTQADALAGGVTPGDAPGFPVTISVTGVYRLASNLLISTAVDGIEVTAPEVTLNLSGFRIDGSGVGVRGISGSQRALTVKDGTIRGFALDAIISQADYLVVDRMRLVDNPISSVNFSVIAAGNFASVTNSNLSRSGQAAGIVCYKYCRIHNNIIVGTGATSFGIYAFDEGSVVTRNAIANFYSALGGPSSVSFGDNVFVGNIGASQTTLVPLDPNAVPPPVP